MIVARTTRAIVLADDVRFVFVSSAMSTSLEAIVGERFGPFYRRLDHSFGSVATQGKAGLSPVSKARRVERSVPYWGHH
jgi:hypothetical protein